MIEIYTSKVIIDGLPMPPTENRIYSPVVRTNREGKNFASNRPSPELKQYQDDFESWHWKHVQSMTKVEKKISTWASEYEKEGHDQLFGVKFTILAVFPHSELITQKLTMKKLDASNRVKALQDCLAKALHIDDNIVVNTEVQKCVDETKRCVLVIEPEPLDHVNRVMRRFL